MKFLKNTRNVLFFVLILSIITLYISYGMSQENKNPIPKTKEEVKEEEQKTLGYNFGEKIAHFFMDSTDTNREISDTLSPVFDESQKEVTASTTEQYEEVMLDYVVDGDTLIVIDKNGLSYKVRLIGIDTAESVHQDESRNNEYGDMASAHTKDLLSSTTTLYLEYDEEVTDQYGRTLAYVWTNLNTDDCNNMLNYVIIRDGYAYHKEFKPNVKYSDLFNSTCKHAQKIKAGLWSYEEFEKLWK